MSKTSYWDKFIDQSVGFEADLPVSTSVAQTTVNNLAHLTDEMCQIRVNWSMQDFSGTSYSSLLYPYGMAFSLTRQEGEVTIYQVEFPLTWLSPTKPANLTIFYKAAGFDASASEDWRLSTYLVAANTMVGLKTNPILADVDSEVPDATLTAKLFKIQMSDYIDILQSAWTPIGLGTEGAPPPIACMLRLEIHFDYNMTAYGAGDIFILQNVLVEEFA